MKILLLLSVLFTINSYASSVVGITAHPLNDEARVITAETTGYMSQRNEMGLGLRYTQEMTKYQLLDLSVSGGQYSRGLGLRAGMDFELLSEDESQPRISVKPYYQYQKFEDSSDNLFGAAPTIRKGLNINGYDFYPYLAIPTGIKIDSTTDVMVYYASLALGASMPFPGANNDRFLLSFEGSKDMGSASDYLSALVSWVWH